MATKVRWKLLPAMMFEEKQSAEKRKNELSAYGHIVEVRPIKNKKLLQDWTNKEIAYGIYIYQEKMESKPKGWEKESQKHRDAYYKGKKKKKYSVSFKRPHHNKLHHIDVEANSVTEASKKANKWMDGAEKGWVEYGITEHKTPKSKEKVTHGYSYRLSDLSPVTYGDWAITFEQNKYSTLSKAKNTITHEEILGIGQYKTTALTNVKKKIKEAHTDTFKNHQTVKEGQIWKDNNSNDNKYVVTTPGKPTEHLNGRPQYRNHLLIKIGKHGQMLAGMTKGNLLGANYEHFHERFTYVGEYTNTNEDFHMRGRIGENRGL
jgi:hypothetical protein